VTLADAIAAAHAANEAKISVHRPQQHINADATLLLQSFSSWCGERGLRALPCAPAVVAHWVQTEGKLSGIHRVKLMLAAIERAHFARGLANPVQTPEVLFQFGELCPLELPHWKDRDRELFSSLPDEIPRAILTREKQRDRALRIKQQQLSEELKRLRGGADKPAAKSNEEPTREKI
jgi:hypothetical protein